jgi:hypothetical protein
MGSFLFVSGAGPFPPAVTTGVHTDQACAVINTDIRGGLARFTIPQAAATATENCLEPSDRRGSLYPPSEGVRHWESYCVDS